MKANIEIFQFKFDSWIKFSKVPLNKGGLRGMFTCFIELTMDTPHNLPCYGRV